jgi:hypothetical protein
MWRSCKKSFTVGFRVAFFGLTARGTHDAPEISGCGSGVIFKGDFNRHGEVVVFNIVYILVLIVVLVIFV